MEQNENGFMAVLNKMANCLIVNTCWFAACLPIFTIGASTTAMYATIQKSILHDRGYVWSTFWKEFKSNFKNATIVWLLVLLVGAVMTFDIRFLFGEAQNGKGWGLLYLLIAVMLVLLILTTLYCFGYLAKFETRRWAAFRNSFTIMLMHPFKNLWFLFLGVLMILLIAFLQWMILFLPVFYMLSFVQFLENTFYDLMTDEEKEREDERNRDYAIEERKQKEEKKK